MTLEEASAIVLADARRNDYHVTVPDDVVLTSVRDTVALNDVINYGDERTEAYQVFLAHHQDPSRAQLCQLIHTLASGYPAHALTAPFQVWLRRVIDGDLT